VKSANSPLVSIIMNCYNGSKYLREAIDSIYKQSYKNWEIIFWDNNSSDDSSEIAKSYDDSIRYYKSNKTIPLGAARREAMKKVKGEWIGFLDTDDIWFPQKLLIQIESLINTDYVFCYAGINDIKPNGEIIRKYLPKYKSGYMIADQLSNFEVNMVTPLMNKRFLDKHSLTFDERISASEEYNLFMRIMAKGKVCTINKILGSWRISEGTTTDKQISNWYKERLLSLDQLIIDNPKIKDLYPAEFQEAYARGYYYKVRYLMHTKNYKKAREEMKSIAFHSAKYFVLYLITFSPFIWRYIHSSIIKRKLSQKILGY